MTTNEQEELRNLDQIGYEHYRYLLDLIYNAGGLHKDHYKLKDSVDRYIESLLSAHLASALDAIEEEVIGADDEWSGAGAVAGQLRDELRREQRQSLQAVRKRYGVKS